MIARPRTASAPRGSCIKRSPGFRGSGSGRPPAPASGCAHSGVVQARPERPLSIMHRGNHSLYLRMHGRRHRVGSDVAGNADRADEIRLWRGFRSVQC